MVERTRSTESYTAMFVIVQKYRILTNYKKIMSAIDILREISTDDW